MKKKNHFIKFSILMMVQALCLTVLAVEDAEMDAYTKTLEKVSLNFAPFLIGMPPRSLPQSFDCT